GKKEIIEKYFDKDTPPLTPAVPAIPDAPPRGDVRTSVTEWAKSLSLGERIRTFWLYRIKPRLPATKRTWQWIGVACLAILFVAIFARQKRYTIQPDTGNISSPAFTSGAPNTTPLPSLTSLVAFSELSRAISPSGAATWKTNAIFWDGETIYNHSLNDGIGKFITLDTGSSVQFGTATEDGVLLFTRDQPYLIKPARNTASRTEFIPHVSENDIAGVSSYGNAVYVLKKDGHILKYSPNSARTQYRGTEWIKENAFVQEPRDIAIDGSIFVLENSSVITRYFGGSRQESGPRATTAFLPQGFVTNDAIPALYALSPTTRSIVEFDKKTLAPKRSFTNDIVADIKAIALSPDGKFLIAAINEKAYRFDLPK
ncbi:MAG: hypothetical protein HY460_00620, partial [Parcubacteria group bacterium]|nr:hypothetical protein [Parcubacteria group bacterium]